MKVLIFTSQFAVGAAEKLGAELAVDLNRNGVHADVMGMYTADRDGAAKAGEELRRRGVPAIHFLGLSPNPSPAQTLAAMARFNKIIRKNRYDIVETSSLTPGIIAAWARLGSSARHVVGLHYAFSTTAAAPRSIKIFLASMRMRPDIRFYAVTGYVKDMWSRFSGTPPERTRIIHNCVPTRPPPLRATRNKIRMGLGIPEKSIVLLCAGRIAAYKRQDVVLDALCMDGDRREFVVLFAGDVDMDVEGTREMVVRMEDTVHRSGLHVNVRFLGHRSDLDDLMASSDLLVHSAEKEAFGMVLAEALAAGLPVVSTDVEGIPEVLEGTDSILVRPGDPAALRRALDSALARDPDSVLQVKMKGIDRAGQFRQEKRTHRMVEYFGEILAGRA